MHSDTLKATDAYSANRSTHPRVSLADMESKIISEHYFTAGEAVRATDQGLTPKDPGPLDILTVCILVMRNGFTIIGKSAPASPENFDLEKGRRFAYEDCIKQLWPLEGYALRERLSAAPKEPEFTGGRVDGFGLFLGKKVVQAAEISAVAINDPAAPTVTCKGVIDQQPVPQGMFSRYTPVEGDFYVIYADGYRSISPRSAFLEGYDPIA